MALSSLSLNKKIFLAIASTTVAMVVLMAVLVAVGMRDGFSRYLLDAELNRFDLLISTLADIHDENTPGWPEFHNEPHVWKDFVRRNWQVGPGEGALGDANANPPRRGVGDGLQIGQRIFLLDAKSQPIVLGRDYGGEAATRPIFKESSNPQEPPLGWLGMSMPKQGQGASDSFYLNHLYRALLWASLVAIGVSLLSATFLTRQFLVPIRQLINGSQILANGDYSAHIKNDRSDELGQLIDHYNELASTLSQSSESERRWISDTSHELQTPLAVLQAQIEALQDGIRSANTETLAALHSGVRQLSRLVQDLKVLAFDREGQLIIKKRTVDLGEIAAEAVAIISPQLNTLNLDMECMQLNEMLVEADGVRIRQVLDNLLENAARYTRPGGKIRLNINEIADSYRVVVEDTLPCPNQDDLPRLFERFFRPDASRSRETGGSGLGLSICRAIVLAHGGSIHVERSDLGGLKVEFELKKASV